MWGATPQYGTDARDQFFWRERFRNIIVSAQIKSTIDKRGENIFELNVTDLGHLNKVMNALLKVKGVIKVERIKS